MALTFAALKPLPHGASKSVSILGSTGTIGQNTIDIIRQHPERFVVKVLTARRNVSLLAEQARILQPELVVVEDESCHAALREALQGSGIETAAGATALTEAASRPVDWVMSGIVGAAALAPTLAAIHQGATIALANKECLVCAGALLTREAKKHGAKLIPVDSEHNAVYQLFDIDQSKQVSKIVLTASGGPFRTWSREQMASATIEQAVTHPNWHMGEKISVDSATMMNKGLEIIEAYHLFPLQPSQIEVLIHPESIVHCLVYYRDGGVAAGLSLPDMKVPIAHALGWPERIPTATKTLDLAKLGSLTFETPDQERFPAIPLARQALELGGSATTTLNAANEIAVNAFLQNKIRFLDIVKLVENTLQKVPPSSPHSLDDVMSVDAESRIIASQLVKNAG